MTPIVTPILQQQQQQNRSSSKRKLDDDDENNVSDDDLVYVRMRKEETTKTTFNPWSGGGGGGGSGGGVGGCNGGLLKKKSDIQFFIRMMPKGNSLVMHAYPEDTVKSIHERLVELHSIPIFEQRLIFRGKQLQWEQTIAQCGIQRDVSLELVGRIRSTEHPQAWQVVNDMVNVVYDLCRQQPVEEAPKTVKSLLTSYISLALTPKPKLDADSATSYFGIFINSAAISVLVTLYVSPYKGNKDTADSCIRHFLNCCRTSLSKIFHTQAARVALEFCKFLRRGAGTHDPLYLFCRSSLGGFLEDAEVSLASSEDQNFKGLVLVQDLFPFVRELADSLLMNLESSIDSPSLACPLLTDIGDFTAFLVPVRTRIEQHQALRGCVPYHKLDRNDLVFEEIEYLHMLYNQMLFKKWRRFFDKEMVHEENYFHPACSLYLSLLKELHKISKLYDGAPEKLRGVLMRLKDFDVSDDC